MTGPGPGAVPRTPVVAVSLTGSVIAGCAFAFSFGNVWHLALLWQVPAPIAPLVAPMLDISVVGLLVTVRHLTLHGVDAGHLLGARALLLLCAITSWGLNIADPVLAHRWGTAVIDSVSPALLLGWAEVGPTLLRLAANPPSPRAAAPVAAAVSTPRPPSGARPLAPPAELPRVHPYPDPGEQQEAPDAA